MAILEYTAKTVTGNLFLDALPDDVMTALTPHLRRIEMPLLFQCTEHRRAVKMVRFPLASVVSIIAQMHKGDVHEIGFVGREGVIGALEVLFKGPSMYESFVQIADSGLEISADYFAATVNDYPELHAALLRYAHASQASTAQSAACNGAHSLEERSAKWMLIAHDRVPTDLIDLTHEFLAQMLNVRRSGVTNAATRLQEMKAIKYARGRITVLDRAILERVACECYRVMNDNAAAILGYDVRKHVP